MRSRVTPLNETTSGGDSPRVAVIIPTKDRESLAASAVRSALAQTYENLEVIVYDDGSVPPLSLPGELIDDDRVRVLRSPNGSVGAAHARNVAVAETSAPLIAFLDDDDEWAPTKIARDVEALQSSDSGNVVLVESGFELWDGEKLVYVYVPDLQRDLKSALLRESILVPSTVLMTRDAYLALDGMDRDLPRTHDWDLWVRLADRFEVISLPEVRTYRKFHHLDAGLIYRSRREQLRRLGPRIRRLPPGPRLKTTLYHLSILGASVVRMGTGDRLWRAVTDPLRWIIRRVKGSGGSGPLISRW